MEHIALTRRNAGPGWLIMTHDGEQWLADTVSATAPLTAMVDGALQLVGRYPGASFTFSTRPAHEVWEAAFDRQEDLPDIRRKLKRSMITALMPNGDGCWRVLHRDPGGWFRHIDTCEPAAVHDFLKSWPQDAEAIERGLAGPVEVWLRRHWLAGAVTESGAVTLGDNVTPFVPKRSAMSLIVGNRPA